MKAHEETVSALEINDGYLYSSDSTGKLAVWGLNQPRFHGWIFPAEPISRFLANDGWLLGQSGSNARLMVWDISSAPDPIVFKGTITRTSAYNDNAIVLKDGQIVKTGSNQLILSSVGANEVPAWLENQRDGFSQVSLCENDRDIVIMIPQRRNEYTIRRISSGEVLAGGRFNQGRDCHLSFVVDLAGGKVEKLFLCAREKRSKVLDAYQLGGNKNEIHFEAVGFETCKLFGEHCVVVGTEKGKVILYDASGTQLLAFRAHTGSTQVAIDGERGIIASGGADATIKLWKISRSGKGTDYEWSVEPLDIAVDSS